jgi:starch phosphorylase
VDGQAAVERAYLDPGRWTRMSILNTARMGRFSSDRSIAEYCREIWRVKPVPIELAPPPV